MNNFNNFNNLPTEIHNLIFTANREDKLKRKYMEVWDNIQAELEHHTTWMADIHYDYWSSSHRDKPITSFNWEK